MMKRMWWKGAWLLLTSGMTLALNYGGCLETTAQRVLVAVAFD